MAQKQMLFQCNIPSKYAIKAAYNSYLVKNYKKASASGRAIWQDGGGVC